MNRASVRTISASAPTARTRVAIGILSPRSGAEIAIITLKPFLRRPAHAAHTTPSVGTNVGEPVLRLNVFTYFLAIDKSGANKAGSGDYCIQCEARHQSRDSAVQVLE